MGLRGLTQPCPWPSCPSPQTAPAHSQPREQPLALWASGGSQRQQGQALLAATTVQFTKACIPSQRAWGPWPTYMGGGGCGHCPGSFSLLAVPPRGGGAEKGPVVAVGPAPLGSREGGHPRQGGRGRAETTTGPPSHPRPHLHSPGATLPASSLPGLQGQLQAQLARGGSSAHHQVAPELVVDDGRHQVHQKQAPLGEKRPRSAEITRSARTMWAGSGGAAASGGQPVSSKPAK